MKYYIIAGEPSGDLHGSLLIQALKKTDPNAQFRAWGGDLMQTAGADLAKHIRELAIMGIGQVLWRLPTILRNFSFCHKDIETYKPDVLILIDYSGFNLRIAKWAKGQGYKIFYYISPQVWATRAGRVQKIKKYVDKLFSILPFETAFYKKYDYEIEFVGHPLLDVVAEYAVTDFGTNFRTKNGLDAQRPIIALLPGSRRQEVKAILNVMLSVVPKFPDYQFVIAGAPTLSPDFYAPFLEGKKGLHLVHGQTYDLLTNSTAALVTSGTATLETALFKVPQVVCYKTGAFLYWIVKQLIKVPYISIVNLIMQREVVKELIQHKLTETQLELELRRLLDASYREKMREAYEELYQKLGEQGAARRAAEKMVGLLGVEK